MSREDEIRLVVIIPVYGNWIDTLATLRALAAQTCGHFRALIADDGSPSEAPAEIHGFEFARYVKRPNAGFAGTCNRAARMAIDDGATHLLFLNSDTDFSPEFIGGWLRTAAGLPNAIVSPIVYWSRKPQVVWYSGGKMTILTPFVRLAREFSKTTAVDIVCGCALWIPVNEWKLLHGFDEKFAVYFEDFDLALRAKAIDIPIFVAADRELRVWHKVGGSFLGDARWKREYYFLESRLLFIRRHFRGMNLMLCYGLTVLHLAAMFLKLFPEIPNPRLLWRAAARGLAEDRS